MSSILQAPHDKIAEIERLTRLLLQGDILNDKDNWALIKMLEELTIIYDRAGKRAWT